MWRPPIVVWNRGKMELTIRATTTVRKNANATAQRGIWKRKLLWSISRIIARTTVRVRTVWRVHRVDFAARSVISFRLRYACENKPHDCRPHKLSLAHYLRRYTAA